jgi:F0F1-type ATP synthase membrane subunit c/vacuolar-type H+-ATPase subunit K
MDATTAMKGVKMRKLIEIGGVLTAVVLVGFGVVAIAMGFSGGRTVTSSLKQEQIIGTSDMTPAGIKAEASKAGLKNITFPTCSVAGVAVTSGATARCFADYMRIHALEATGGFVYSQMGIYIAKPGTPKSQLMTGGGTDNAAFALVDPTTKQPVSNGARNVWVTETALTTALNVSFMAARLALFGIVVGFALLLAGIGFGILSIGGALRHPETAPWFAFGKGKMIGQVPASVA